jgi:NADPH:quinone reductase-like Zn-dependent oxidoreductase
MKAIEYTEYGSPNVLRLNDVEIPSPKDNEVLVKIHAASANPLDWHLMRAEPFLARFENGLLKPKNTKLGADVAGRVEARGKNATQFHIGDAVFGAQYIKDLGAFAEYVCMPENILAQKPENISFKAAAAVPIAAYTALQGLRNKGKIQAGQKVLINGASGGVGTFAVQIAKSVGPEVTGVCSSRNLDLVRSIGADHVIDYTKEDFTRTGKQYDLIFDAVGNCSVADYQRALRPNGICSVAGFTTLSRLFQVILLGAFVSMTENQKIGLMETARPDHNDLLFLKELLESGRVVPVIDRTYTLNQVPEAIAYLEEGRARGKVVISVVE